MLLAVVLVGFGTVMVYSASSVLAHVRFESDSFFLKRWVLRTVVSLIAMYVMMRVNYRRWAKLSSYVLMLGFLGLLVVIAFKVLGIGKVRGAYRWIPIPGGSFQPSDLMRLALVVYLAHSLSRHHALIRNFRRGYLPHLAVVGAATFLIILQPDLGTAMAVGLTCALMLYLGGARLWHLIATLLALLPFLYLTIFTLGYRKERILSFLNPEQDLHGTGYQVAQSLLALGSGGLTGLGLGQSLQKYLFLPEPHTDFVFSIVGEELGLVGAGGLVLLFMMFGRIGLQIARNATDGFGFLLASGITFMVLVYAFVNVGVCIGLLPTTGLPLPFISYGGSSLLLTMIATGTLINIGKSSKENSGELPRVKFAPYSGQARLVSNRL